MNSYASKDSYNRNSLTREKGIPQLARAAKPLVDNRQKGAAQRMLPDSAKGTVQYMLDNRPKNPVPVKKDIIPIQMRTAASRGANRRTYKLPNDVQTHIFTNANNGTGFHSIAANPANLLAHVQQTDARNRNTQAYRADHLDNAGHVIQAGSNKSMFPDGWSRAKVVDVIEKALTNPGVGANAKTAINASGTTEANNRDLPPVNNGKVRGKASGIKVEGIMGGGELATVYPRIP